MSKEKNYQSLPENDGIYHFGYYVVTWDTKGDYVSHVYHGTQRKGANLKKNQTLELCTGGGWENKK